MTHIPYFAFGSNMLTHRLLARVGSARLIGTAHAAGWRLAFHKRGADGSGKCDLCPAHAADTVTGVLFELDEAGMEVLDGFEGAGYRRVQIRLHCNGDWIQAVAYRAETSYCDATLRPFGWYRQLVIAGLIEHRMSPDEIASAQQAPWLPDPEPDRPARLQALAALKAFCASRPEVAHQLPSHERR